MATVGQRGICYYNSSAIYDGNFKEQDFVAIKTAAPSTMALCKVNITDANIILCNNYVFKMKFGKEMAS